MRYARCAMAIKLITQNRKVGHDYHLLKAFEAGLELVGSEVKSVRAGQISINEAHVRPRRGEMWLINAHIAPYQAGQAESPEPTRSRKLLLHKNEITKLIGESQEKSQTIVPTKVYFKKGLVKVEIALAKGKKLHDKRAVIKAREQQREADKAIKQSVNKSLG